MQQAEHFNSQSLMMQLQQLAQSGQVAHAYIVETKDLTQTQMEMAAAYQALLCSKQDSNNLYACQQCKSCALFQAGHHPDFKVVKSETDTIGIDEIRMVSEWLTKTPQIANSQVVVIDQAQNMTENAANALLKTLEEPTDNSYLFLINNSSQKLLPTISSRCQLIRQPTATREQLSKQYPDVPNYLIGFANGNESLIKSWADAEVQKPYVDFYAQVMTWLKNQSSANGLIKMLKNNTSLMPFFVYIIKRRSHQMLLNGYLDNATQVLSIVEQFNFADKNIKGQNKELSIVAFVNNLEPWIK